MLLMLSWMLCDCGSLCPGDGGRWFAVGLDDYLRPFPSSCCILSYVFCLVLSFVSLEEGLLYGSPFPPASGYTGICDKPSYAEGGDMAHVDLGCHCVGPFLLLALKQAVTCVTSSGLRGSILVCLILELGLVCDVDVS
jgi:hypothetical protein